MIAAPCILLISLLSAAEEHPAIRFARELGERPIYIEKKGEREVWAWTKSNAPVRISVRRHVLTFASKEKSSRKSTGYRWINVGTTQVASGPVEIDLPADVAGVSVGLPGEFNPDRVMASRVFKEPVAAQDRRATLLRETNTVFTMPHFESVAKWEAFAEGLRRRILLSSGLYPLPERTPLNAKIFDKIAHEDYSIEKVYFEARPGFYVTGNLYRPVGEGPFPGVLCPHGHWGEGRLENSDTGSVPGRCITLARMGMVALSIDMLGYNDSCQVTHRWSHDVEKLWGVHPFALQLWSSIRAVDFLQGLPDVDAERIGCTGASGGGTQTFALMAVDPRVKVAAPVNMISSRMQGGCVCENAPLIRLDNSNMEIGALMAPRPLLMVSATGDWTRETPRVEYPGIRSVYELYGAEDRVENVHVDAGHNYNQSSREAMYRFFGKWLLDDGEGWEDFTEPPFTVEPLEHLRVFPDKRLPGGALDEEGIVQGAIEAVRKNLQGHAPRTVEDLHAFRDAYGPALKEVIGAVRPRLNDLRSTRMGYEEKGEHIIEGWVIGRAAAGDAIPALFYRSSGTEKQDAVLVVHGKGKGAVLRHWDGLVKGLLEQGKAVLLIDTFLTGEHHSPFSYTERNREGAFMDTFLPTDAGYRVQDVLTALAFLRARRDLTGAIDVVGLGDGGIWCLFASAIDGDVTRTIIDAHRFSSKSDREWATRCYIPSIRVVGDVDTAATLLYPRPLYIMDTGDAFDVDFMRHIYGMGSRGRLEVKASPYTTAELLAILNDA